MVANDLNEDFSSQEFGVKGTPLVSCFECWKVEGETDTRGDEPLRRRGGDLLINNHPYLITIQS